MSNYEQDIKDAVVSRYKIKHEISASEFGTHLCMMYGYDAAHAVFVMNGCVRAGLMWVGVCSRAYSGRAGRSDYAVLTGPGKRLAMQQVSA